MKKSIYTLISFCLLCLASAPVLMGQGLVCDCKPCTKSIGDEVKVGGDTYTVNDIHLTAKGCQNDCSGICWWTWTAENSKGWSVSKGEFVDCEYKVRQHVIHNKKDFNLVLEYLHPNPVQSGTPLNFQLDVKKGNAQVELLDMQGKSHRVLSCDPSFMGELQSISTQGLSPGIYVLKIESDSESHSYRVVIQ